MRTVGFATALRGSLAATIALLAVGGGPRALADGQASLDLSGFATLGYAMTDRRAAEYRTGSALDGADHDGSFALDSRIGVQADARLNTVLSATVQVQARERGDGGAGIEPEWAFVRLQPTGGVTVRIGRMSQPLFAVSDFRAVGYANVPMRPPEDLYSLVPMQRFDGVDVNIEAETGDTLWRFQTLIGESSESYYGIDFDANDIHGGFVEAERGSLRLRLGHVRADLELRFEGIDEVAGALNAAAIDDPGLQSSAAQLLRGRAPASFDILGLMYDDGRWFADLEYTRRRTGDWSPDADGWAFNAGLRTGTLTPYVLASGYRDAEPDRQVQLPPSDRFAALQSLLDGLYEKRDQRSLGLGLRWDVAPNIALKGQVEHVASRFTGISLFRSADEERPPPGSSITLLGLSVNVIF